MSRLLAVWRTGQIGRTASRDLRTLQSVLRIGCTTAPSTKSTSRLFSSNPVHGSSTTAERALAAARDRAAARRSARSGFKQPLPPSLALAQKLSKDADSSSTEHLDASEDSRLGRTTAPVVAGKGQELVLSPPALVVTREFEFGNILLGFEQANKYTIRAAPGGVVVGFIAETDSIGKSILRNIMRTHRSFKATVFDPHGDPIFEIRRPAYLISTNMYVHEPGDDGEEIGQIEMSWHPWKRRYALFTGGTQFAECDTGFLGVDFEMKAEDGKTLARVNKDFTGFAREIFTDARQYVIRLDPSHNMTSEGFANVDAATIAAGHSREDIGGNAELDWKKRAVVLASGICIDFDYFSLHSRGGLGPGGMFMPMPNPGGGGGGGAGGAGGGAAGGAAGGIAGGAAGEAASGGADPGDGGHGEGFGENPPPAEESFGEDFGNVSSDAGGQEWAEFEEPDMGFQEDPANGDGWSPGGSGGGWGEGMGDLPEGGEEGATGLIGSIFSLISSMFSDD